MMAWKIY